MKALVTMPEGFNKSRFFTEETQRLLAEYYDVTYNPLNRDYTEAELKEAIRGMDAVITGWGTPSFIGGRALEGNDTVKIIAHTAGSVADMLDMTPYEQGIRVVSGNKMFAESVAEGTIGYMIAALRRIPDEVQLMRNGGWKTKGIVPSQGLMDRTIGIIGYGSISKYLMQMLQPFRVKIKIFYHHSIDDAFLAAIGAQRVDTLEEIFRTCDIVTLHSALNDQTKGMIRGEHFAMMQEGALFVNTARGAIIREDEMIEELKKGRIQAFLDVFAVEPPVADSPMRTLPNVYCMPHRGGPTGDRWPYIGKAVVEDVIRFAKGEPLLYEIPRAQAALMTRAVR